VEGFLISHPPNLSYLFNICPSVGFALCSPEASVLILDPRYIEQGETEAVNCRLLKARNSLEETLEEAVAELASQSSSPFRLAVESRYVSFATAQLISGWSANYQVLPREDVIENLRMLKEPYEIRALENAFRIAQAAFTDILPEIGPGRTEIEIAGLFELELRKRGAEKAAFDTIVASGPRSSLPHGRASERVIQTDEIVLLDFGVQAAGYSSDLTRVVFPDPTRQPDIFEIVREAQQKAIKAARPGVLTSAVDAAARDHIAKNGYGDCFGHSLGHGLGLEVHESPLVSWRTPRPLQEGMVFTVEPGIYLPGRYGVRIEDAVVVTADGCRLLSDPDR
jgi:Xaa-Pro aminopeptidase